MVIPGANPKIVCTTVETAASQLSACLPNLSVPRRLSKGSQCVEAYELLRSFASIIGHFLSSCHGLRFPACLDEI